MFSRRRKEKKKKVDGVSIAGAKVRSKRDLFFFVNDVICPPPAKVLLTRKGISFPSNDCRIAIEPRSGKHGVIAESK